MTAAEPRSAPRTVLVAGAAGGVGTTTVAALLAMAWAQAEGGSPNLVDHSGGSLRFRLPPAWAPSGVLDLTIDDRGAHPIRAAAAVNAQPGSVLLLVASSTPTSLALLPPLLDELGPTPLHLVLAQVHGRHRPRRDRVPAGHAADLVVPRDDALAADGPVDWSNVARRTRTAVAGLVAALKAGPPTMAPPE